MKKTARFFGVFLAAALFCTGFTANAHAAQSEEIDLSRANEGYFTVNYAGNTKMKVGVTYEGVTSYYDYTPGESASYALTCGDGAYQITLYSNVSGRSYRAVRSVRTDVQLGSAMAPYLASTKEITFTQEDSVGRKAAELCQGLTEDEDKVVAIHNYVAANFSYDYDLFDRVNRGEVRTYTPDTNQVLAAGKGICYDLSAVFAAMCRSQNIPCALVKGVYNGGNHAWNMVYVNGQWQSMDLTRSVGAQRCGAVLADCLVSQTGYVSAGF